MIRKIIYHLTILLVTFVVLVACSTSKNTFTRRVYHNLTAHYNAYWNGNESLKEGISELSKTNKDNYTEVLTVFQSGTKEEAQKVNPQMDRAIEKGVKVIRMHSIFIKGKEHIRWIDDAYLMIGKSNYYKQEYRTAIRTFNFIISQFKTNPIKYEAMVWLARTNNQLGEFNAAQPMLDMVRNKISSGDAPKSLQRDVDMVYADFYIKQENYSPAIEYLISAIKLTHKKDIKTRLCFILAQIYQREGELAKATELYQKVIRKNPPYEMAFNARINLAMSYDAASGDSKALEKKLTKMLKDNKNKEFLDQIYFALAEVALRNKDKTTAIKYLKLSVSSSVSNNFQKAISSLKLADLYFDLPEYENAQAYYDSTIMFLPKTYKNYDVITSKAEVLNELVKNIQIVTVQDSLQKMALMKPDERDQKINNTIAAIFKEEQRKAEEENANRQALNFLQNTRQSLSGNPGANAGEWYFYNPSTMSFGFSEFSKKWGKRKLEDNWRISNKQTIDFGDVQSNKNETNEDGETKDTSAMASNPKNKAFYLKDVPLTEEKMKKSNDKVEKALYNMGYIYYEGLKDLKKAKETFEILITRFPNGKQCLGSYYQLYQINSDLEDQAKKNYYKDLILKDYPESDYAKIINDPDYYKQIQARKNEINLFYDETYKAFISENYRKVADNYQSAASKYKLSPIFPKFEYLNALSLGKTKGKDTLTTSLNSLITKYPNHEIIPMAQMVLAYLNKGNDVNLAKYEAAKPSTENKSKKGAESKKIAESKKLIETKSAENPNPIKTDTVTQTKIIPNSIKEQLSVYKENSSGLHFFILMVDASKVNVNVLKIKISDFNRKYYSTSNLEITSVIYNQNIHLISVAQFDNAENALLYYNTIKGNEYIYSSLDVSSTIDFVITAENFTAFYKLKDLDGYQSFFKYIYLKK